MVSKLNVAFVDELSEGASIEAFGNDGLELGASPGFHVHCLFGCRDFGVQLDSVVKVEKLLKSILQGFAG
jgi:hypothetical protein